MSLAAISLFLTSTTHAGFPLVVHRPLSLVNDNYTDNNQKNVDQSKDSEHYTITKIRKEKKQKLLA